jgi:hypothetical protein
LWKILLLLHKRDVVGPDLNLVLQVG